MASQVNVYQEISKALKLPFPGGDEQEYLTKLVGKFNGLSDTAWDKLKEPTQVWCNAATEAADKDEEIPVPTGMEAEADDEDEEEAKPTKRIKAKANGKSKPEKPSKPVKGKKGEADESDDDDDDAPTKPAKGKKDKVAKPEKKGKGAKPEKKGKAKKGGLTGKRARRFADDQRIVVLCKENPKREGSSARDRFDLYETGKKGMTVKAALEAGVTSGDLNYDTDHDYIEIT